MFTACRLFLLMLSLLLLSACNTAPYSEKDRGLLEFSARLTVDRFKQVDPSMTERFNNALAYAVFPQVSKAGAGVGGGYGQGVLYERGQLVGYCNLSQTTVGVQLGVQEYREVIFFTSPKALLDFKNGWLELAGQASAVATRQGAARGMNYDPGVMVFTMPRDGLMGEVAVGGQRFTFKPL
ncbi:MAG: hypothetical protein IT445_20370 [Phycisphaeraceae bacterium]|nr:hypothetical protein [Phycisphaeraceae bacterium]